MTTLVMPITMAFRVKMSAGKTKRPTQLERMLTRVQGPFSAKVLRPSLRRSLCLRVPENGHAKR